MTEDISRVIVEINDKKAAEKIESLEKKADELRKKLQEAIDLKDQKAIDNISKKLKETGRQIDQVRTKADKVRAAMRSLDAATPKQLRETIRAITSELNSGKIARGSKEWDAYVAKLKVAKAELAKVQAEMSVTTTKATKLRDVINSWGASVAAGMAAFAGVVMTGKNAVETYAEMEQEEANVRKFTGMTADEVSRLNEEFKKMDTRTSRQELNKLAQEAGRLGKTSQEDVLGFVRAADKINVALDDLGDGATLTLSKLTGIFDIDKKYGTEKSLLKVGSVINELSQNCSASAPYLAEFASRMGGVGAQAGLTIQQIMGFGAVLDDNNLKVEAASTAISQVLTRMYKEPAKYAKVAGIEVKSFTKLLKEDANEALLTLLSALDKAGNMEAIAPMLGEIGESGARVTTTLSALAKKINDVRSQQKEANKAFAEGISIDKEFAVQNETVQAGLEKARKKFTERAVALGKELLPALRDCISGTSALMRVLLTLIQFIKEHKAAIVTLTLTIVGYHAAVFIATGRLKAMVLAQLTAVKGANAMKIAYALVTPVIAGLTNTVQYLTNGLQVNYAMQQRWSKATTAFTSVLKKMPPQALAVAAAIAAIGGAYYILSKRTTVQAQAEKDLNDIRKTASKRIIEQKVEIEALERVARNENMSLSERWHAVNKLNQIIPDYNAQIDATTGKYKASKEALDEYLKSLKAQYELEGVKDKLAEYGKQKADIEEERENIIDEMKRNPQSQRKANNQNAAAFAGGGIVPLGNAVGIANAVEGVRDYEAELKVLDKQLEDIAAKEEIIGRIYERKSNEVSPTKVADKDKDLDNEELPPRGLSEKELKKLQKEREKQLKEEARKAKAELLQAIAEITVLREQSLAENTAMYADGLKDYRQYVEDEHDIRLKAVRDEKKVYEDRNLTSTKEYAKLIKEETDLLYKFSQTKRKLSLQELEKEKQDRKNFLTEAYSNPKSAMYGNDKAYRQKMLEADIEYLQKKKALYAAGSDEYEKISLEIEQKLADDKLQKQKELAVNYENWRQQYEDMSGSAREQKELDMLKSLYDAKLISEENYQEAVNDIKNKNMLADQERHRKTQSEYGDMVLNIRNSFKILFDDIKDGGKLSLDNLASATESAFAVMGAALQSYSSFVNAERDAELAKVEARYDKEIKAAGSNSKKKEKLEKQKEEETAKVKNKYAKRQQAVEIATAMANTAQAALNAYASTVQIPVVGPTIAPIAAAVATAFGLMQVATIKKQYEANQGYYSGGFTKKDPDNRREVGVVHANEFVANHEAVENAAISPVLRLIDYAQRNNRVAALTRADVSNALGQGSGVSARGALLSPAPVIVQTQQPAESSKAPEVLEKVGESIDRLNRSLENGIESFAVIDGENGLANRLNRFNRLKNNPKRGKK